MNYFKVISQIVFCTLLISFISCDYEREEVKSLNGRWKFSIGDNMKWANAEFDDSKWDDIHVPASWEEQGYDDYNGFAWYRKHLRVAKKFEEIPLYLNLGRVDDADEVFFNGVLIGKTGTFPPKYLGKYTENRRYMIPKNLIKYGVDNVIAVRVYDNREDGGIRDGEVGLFTKDEMSLDFDLSGDWKFHLFDSLEWKEPNIDDSQWHTIKVPAYYEDEGFEEYDGFSWYRKKFDLPAQLKNQKIVLLMGKIDDMDQVYINGTFIGGLGEFRSTADSIDTRDDHNEFRGYYLPDNFVLNETGNVIAVRIFDGGGRGGIYQGPIGLINQENYAGYWEKIRKKKW